MCGEGVSSLHDRKRTPLGIFIGTPGVRADDSQSQSVQRSKKRDDNNNRSVAGLLKLVQQPQDDDGETVSNAENQADDPPSASNRMGRSVKANTLSSR